MPVKTSQRGAPWARALGLAAVLACSNSVVAAQRPDAPAPQASAPAAAFLQDTGWLPLARAGDAAALGQLKAAAEAGQPRALHELGSYWLDKGAYGEAYGWIRRAAEAGDPRAIYDLGVLLLNGVGVAQRDPALAQQYFVRAGARGFPSGYRMAAEVALTGSGGKADTDAAQRWLRLAAEAGDVQAQSRLASLLARQARGADDMAEPVAWLRRAAEAGHAQSADQLGLLALAGFGVPQDLAAARQWFEQAAAAGWVPAKVRLAQLLLQSSAASDVARGRAVLAEAAGAGNAEARIQFFEMNRVAGQVPDAQAVAWLRSAAEEGHPRAAQLLGDAYRTGRGVPADAAQAQYWLARAAASGEPAVFREALAAAAKASPAR